MRIVLSLMAGLVLLMTMPQVSAQDEFDDEIAAESQDFEEFAESDAGGGAEFADDEFADGGDEFDDEEFSDEQFSESDEIQPDPENNLVDPIQEEQTFVDAAPSPVEETEDMTGGDFDSAPLDEPQEPVFSSDFETPPPSVSDDPDYELENRFHNLYRTFHSEPTPAGDWNSALTQRQVDSYLIQRRDTLWDISKTLFGDGNYWPKVWSLNADIKNPHLISPNNQIRFIFGTESSPPQFTVTQTQIKTEVSQDIDVDSETDSAPVNVEAGYQPEPEIPPPLRVSRPVLKRPPPSLPEWQNAGVFGNYDDLGVDYGKRKILELKDEIELPGYVTETEPEALGEVAEIEVGNRMASAYQYIYVSMQSGTGEVGDTYLAVNSRGKVQSAHPTISGDLGYGIDVQGEIQLVERIDGGVLGGDVFRALVLRIVSPVTVGAKLIEGNIEKIKLSEVGPRSQVVAQIVGGSFFARRQVYGVESIAFLNRGERDGLQVGNVLPIRANMKVRKQDTIVEENVRPIGWLRVVKTTPRLATAVIVRVWSDVVTGDLTGTGKFDDSVQNARLGDDADGELLDELEADDGAPTDAEDFEGGADDFGDENFDEDEEF